MPRERGSAVKRRIIGRLSEALPEAGLVGRVVDENDEGSVMELSGDVLGNRRSVGFVRSGGETELAVEVTIPAEAGLRGAPLRSEETLRLLGALSLGAASSGLKVQPLADTEGLTAVLVSRQMCDDQLSPDRIRAELGVLASTADRLSRALVEADRVSAIGDAFRPPQTIDRIDVAADDDVVLAPTFDEEVRDRLMREAGLAAEE